jgi:hypothetical protein
METVQFGNINAKPAKPEKVIYSRPTLTIYGDAKEITLKTKGLQDHNQSQGNNPNDGNDMGWS